MRKSAFSALMLLGIVLFTCTATAMERHVPSEYATIQAAIDDCNNGDVVIVEPNTYTGDGNRDIDFLGKAITVRSTDPNDPNIVTDTVIDCQSSGRGFYFNSGEGPNSLLSGITITNGNVSGVGGGIYCRYSSPTITNCRVIDNYARDKGGGIFCRDGNATIRRCQVIGNTIYEDYNKTGKGAGIMVWGCSPLIENCIIKNNSTTGTYGHGGGIHGRDGANPTIRNCLIFGNYAVNYGGGINNGYNASCIVEGCTVADNTAGSGGAGINGDNAIVTNSIIWNNSGTEILGNFIEVSYSNIEGGFSGIGNIDQYPYYDSNYRLLGFSPCVDVGDPDFIPTYKETDIDGEARVMNSRVDMGADEYTSTPTPFLDVWPDSISFYAPDVNGSNPGNKVLHIRNLGFGILNWQAVEESAWLEIDPNNGNCTDETDLITLTVDINGLQEGAYQCELTISGPNSGNSPKVVNIDLKVGRAVIELDPSEFEFSFSPNSSTPIDKVMLVKNLGGKSLNWNIETDCNWITVEPNTGSTEPLGSNEVILSVDCVGFEVGDYSCELTVSDPCAMNSPQTVDIILHVSSELLVPSEYSTIQSAIDSAINGDTVIVADGVYTGDGNRDIDFLGKAITVKSENGPENCIIDCDATFWENHRGFYFNNGEGRDSVLEGFTITNAYVTVMCEGGAGIYINGASPTISRCIITDNHVRLDPESLCFCLGGGIYIGHDSNPLITDCTISNNSVADWGWGGGIYCEYSHMTIHNCLINNNTALGIEGMGGGIFCTGDSTVTNCTIANNSATQDGGGICGHANVKNSIIWANAAINQIQGSANINYSDVQGSFPGTGNINADPLFTNPSSGDYHLQSQAGRWDLNSESWVTDAVTSPCIDAGNPGCPLGDEPNDSNNIRINMGAYGGTVEASKTPADWRSIADLTNDWVVNLNDLSVFVSYWLDSDQSIPSDLNRNQSVNFVDYAVFAQQWPSAPAAEPGIEYEITPCDIGSSTVEQSGETRFTVTVQGRYILFEDMMVANCCPDELELQMVVEGNLITIHEVEYLSMPCDCICDYPVTATLGPFEPGIYTLEVYQDGYYGGFIGSTIITIE